MKKSLVFLLVFMFVFTSFAIPAFASLGTKSGAGPTNYTYNFSFWGEEVAMPDPYRVTGQINGHDFGIGNFNQPQGQFIRDNRLYICDTGNNRIVLLEYNEETGFFSFVREVRSVIIDGQESPLNAPHDLFENRNGEIFIADTDNNRVLRLDADFNYINSILKPDDRSFEANLSFFPSKLVVDHSNRLFVQARHVNMGLMEFELNGTFSGYMGASNVQVSIIDYFWKMIATETARQRMELFVPTEYNNVALDHEGFVYATLSTFSGHPEEADPVRRLNSVGTDILIRNGLFGYAAPIGDWFWPGSGVFSGPSQFADVTVFENNGYICLDRLRGRLFAYDFQGNLLYAFGGAGDAEGRFRGAVALDRMGSTLFVLDRDTGIITRFDLTEYGRYIDEAMNYYFNGLYDESAVMWDRVLKYNGNYDLAFIGKGRAALRNENYYEAMRLYEAKYDQENYGKAFALYRKQWIEEHIATILICAVSLYVFVKIIRIVVKIAKKKKRGKAL